MLVLLYGPDDYRRKQKNDELLAEFEKKHSRLGVGRFDMEAEDGFARFREFTRTRSMFEPFKFVALDNAYALTRKEYRDELRSLAGAKEVVVLISERERPPKGFEFLLRASKNILVQKFEHLTGKAWQAFIETEAGKRGAQFTGAALKFLGEAYQNDSWRLVTEIEKIGLLGKKTLDQKDLARLDIEIAPDFWELVGGFRAPRLADRIAALERVFAANEPAGKVFNILAYGDPQKLAAMAAYDTAVKSGKLDYEEVLLDFIL